MIKKNIIWATVFAGIVLICAAVIIGRAVLAKPARSAQIIQRGKVICTVDLTEKTEPYEFEVTSENGGHNTVRVENGKIGIIHADCPDKICVKQGLTDSSAQSIVCLPHQLSIAISSNDSGTDAVAGGF